ncbi:hypothetical protein ACVGOW_29625 [Pseudonocardia saturnea]
MYAVVRTYEDEDPDVIEQIRARGDGFREVLRGIDGFVAYYLIDAGSGRITTVSVFSDRAGAEESSRAAGKFVEDNLAQWVPNPPTVIQGEVALDA